MHRILPALVWFCLASPLLAQAPDSAAGSPISLEAAPDSLVANRLRRIFSAVDEFERIRVGVTNGVVRLTGTVLQAASADRAEELAARVEGVLYVDNDVESETNVELRVNPALERLQEYYRNASSFLPVLAVAFLVILVFWVVSYFIGKWRAPVTHLGLNPLVWGLMRRLLRSLVFVTGLVLAFDILGITTMVGALLGAAGVVGLALGFAFQDIVENYLAGMLLSIRRPFRINDLVRIGDHEGRVVRLTSRELLLLSLDGNHIRLPNATVFKSTLINYTLNHRRLFSFDVGIGPGEDLEKGMEVGVSTLAAMNGVMNDPPPFSRVQELGESSVVVRYFGWVDQEAADYFKVRSEAIRVVKRALDEAEVELPEPIYRVVYQKYVPPPRPAREASSALEEARSVEANPDRALDEQIREEITRNDGENYL